MNSHATNVIAAEPPAESDYHRYMVGSRLEISQILHTIMRRTALISAASGANDCFLTTLLAVDDEEGYLLLECAPHRENNEHALKKQKLSCSTTLDRVQIQFPCKHIETVIHDGRNAFKAPLPSAMLRLQRRENYRIATSLAAPVKCTLSAVHARATVELNLCDISCGGLAVIATPEIFTPELGAEYSCIIRLPGTTGLTTAIQARNTFMVTQGNGKIMQRSGFAYGKLQESLLANIQRYIMGLERQRGTRDT